MTWMDLPNWQPGVLTSQHDWWPADLDSAAQCVACGLDYGQWNERDLDCPGAG